MGFGLQSCDKENNNGGGGNGSVTTYVEWVDLGLPSGLLWADRNVGSKNAEDYGNYYAWGETAPKEAYTWNNYTYRDAENYLTKYCNKPGYGSNGFTDNLTTLEASDDAATVNIGGGARTPAKEEWQELIDNTTSTWTTQNGVHGILFTASNGKSIFLPAAGVRNSSSLDYVGELCYYWSSTLDTYVAYNAWRLYCDDYSRNPHLDNGVSRFLGHSVRAVRAGQN